MTWLFVVFFVATFAAVAVASFKLNRDANRTAERELLQAAAAQRSLGRWCYELATPSFEVKPSPRSPTTSPIRWSSPR